MRFVCLRYMEENKWNAMSKSEQEAWVEECLAYYDALRTSGGWTGSGEALQSSRTAKTLRRKGGKLLVTDGPFAETKEQLGGFGVLEAKDLDEAVALLSKHPGVRSGVFEIRPIDEEITTRCQKTTPAPDPSAGGMKFVCLGYGDESNWNALSPGEMEAMLETCIAYGEELAKHGGWVDGVALKGARTAKTLRLKRGKVLVTDGPYAETKEQLGGVATFKFRDIDQAVKSWSKHPCLRLGDSLELRPADEEFEALVAAREAAVQAK